MPLPEPFKDEREFLKYFEKRSKTQKPSFSIEQVNYLYELAGEPPLFNFSSPYVFMSLRFNNSETRKLIRKANKNISEKMKREYGDSVAHLDDYLINKNVANLDDYR